MYYYLQITIIANGRNR